MTHDVGSLQGLQERFCMSEAVSRTNPYLYPDFSPDHPEHNNPAWLKASIANNSLSRTEERATWNFLKHLKTLVPNDEMTAFTNDLMQLIAPLVLTAHGYRQSLGSWDQTKAWGEISSSIALLTDMGLTSFVNSGTLLGLVREGALIKHDDDADLGVILPGDTIKEVIEALVDLARKLVAAKLMNRAQVERGCKHLCLNGALYTDLFPCFVLGGEFFAYPHGTLAPTDMLPLGTRLIEGHSVPVPAQAETFLELCYGPDWQTPDSVYEYPWARSAEIFKDFNAEFSRQFDLILPELAVAAS
jgi:hypothetical protein